MWSNLRKYSVQFESAVLTGMDANGYPYSIRCTPQFDDDKQVMRLAMATGADIMPGRAGMLYHQHNEQLWNLKSFLVRGRIEQDTQGWVLYPEQLILGGGLGNPLRDAAVIFRLRRAAKHYLQKRGLERPRIPWEAIKALYPPPKPKE